MLFRSHDLAVVDCVATRIAVMHRGRIVELGSKDDVLSAPGHPYTRTLLGSVLKIDMPALKDRADRAPGQQDHTSLLR